MQMGIFSYLRKVILLYLILGILLNRPFFYLIKRLLLAGPSNLF